jgi:hypothetical protein
MDGMDQREYQIPDYQRDSSQWNLTKRSLLIESIVNNFTIPPIIVFPHDNDDGIEIKDIIDGQQRVTTLREYIKGGFALASDSDVSYSENVAPHIQGKYFAELPPDIQRRIQNYTINMIVLPKNLELSLRLSIFRRINEGGVPLSAQDLRLAQFSDSPRVYFIRIAGIFEPMGESGKRMLGAASARFDLEYPWKDCSAWRIWWAGSRLSIGQTPSEMFLHYCIAKDIGQFSGVLASETAKSVLQMSFDNTTVGALDLYCAQTARESTATGAASMLADLDRLKEWFASFEQWFNALKQAKVPNISPNSSTKIAYFIAAATRVWENPATVTEREWETLQLLLTQGPLNFERRFGQTYRISRGKWLGQKAQIESIYNIARDIHARNK